MSMFGSLFSGVLKPLFTPLFEDDPAFLSLMEGGFLTMQSGGKIELH